MKGTIRSDHIPKNKYSLRVRGMPSIVFTDIGSLEEELEKVDIPDRTAASGGQTKTIEFDGTVPTHHTEEIQALESWFVEGQDPVARTYKKTGVLVKQSISGMTTVSYTLLGLFVWKRNTEDLAMENEGEMDTTTWSFSCDKIEPRYA